MDRRQFVTGTVGVAVGGAVGAYVQSQRKGNGHRSISWQHHPGLKLAEPTKAVLTSLGDLGEIYLVGGSAASVISGRTPSKITVICDCPIAKVKSWVEANSVTAIPSILTTQGVTQFMHEGTLFTVDCKSLDSYRNRLAFAERQGTVAFAHDSVILDPTNASYVSPIGYIGETPSDSPLPVKVTSRARGDIAVAMAGYSAVADYDLVIGADFQRYCDDVCNDVRNRSASVVTSVVDNLPGLLKVLPAAAIDGFFSQPGVKDAFGKCLGTTVQSVSSQIGQIRNQTGGKYSDNVLCLSVLLGSGKVDLHRQRLEMCYLTEKKIPRNLGMVTNAIALTNVLPAMTV